jgi:hypothetical protein
MLVEAEWAGANNEGAKMTVDNKQQHFLNQPVRLWHLLLSLVYLTYLFGGWQGDGLLQAVLIAACVYILYYVGSSNPHFYEKESIEEEVKE